VEGKEEREVKYTERGRGRVWRTEEDFEILHLWISILMTDFNFQLVSFAASLWGPCSL